MIDLPKLNAVIRSVDERQAKTLTCPECERSSALLTLSFRNLRIAHLCRFCSHVSYAKGLVEDKKRVPPVSYISRKLRASPAKITARE